MSVEYRDAANKSLGVEKADCPDLGPVCNVGNLALKNPPLWSPRTPQNQVMAAVAARAAAARAGAARADALSLSQLTATITLLDSNKQLLDSKVVKFGLKKLEIVGYHWKLNGVWLYLHGYGDDSIYPMNTAPPVNFSFYRERLRVPSEQVYSRNPAVNSLSNPCCHPQVIEQLGMNFVRHHSHILPKEYFDAACDAGVMVSAEFPLAYGA